MQVIEKFISINGEGLRQGELAVFLRFAGCNLRCTYCDTKYSFENPIYTLESVDEIVDFCVNSNIKNITITGGEPLLQSDIYNLLFELSKKGFNIEVETNGSIDIKKYKDIENLSFTLDCKTPISKMDKHMNFSNYSYITKKDSVKFVCGTNADLERMLEIINKYDLLNKTNCLVSPVFGEIQLDRIVEFMIQNNLNSLKYCLQIHKYIWDKDKRGV